MAEPQRYIGLISGTSMDGVDAVLVDLGGTAPRLLMQHNQPIPSALAEQLHAICTPGEDEINRLGELDIQVANLFAEAAQQLLAKSGHPASAVIAIGSHGQTVRHAPDLSHPFTLQIGDGNTLAALTGIDVIADFRRKDMALGGQGAPLVPAFHQAVFGHTASSAGGDRVILNIGGIANLTYLPGAASADKAVIGYDCGPGNTLMDHWCYRHQGLRYDADGHWAATGSINQPLLERLMSEPFLQLAAPKSTGRELFNLDWLDKHLRGLPPLAPEDVQATLLAFTATTSAGAIRAHAADGEVFVCGGGAHNRQLMQALADALPSHRVSTTCELGVDVDWVEAITFAWLAQRFIQRQPGNLPSVTGARREAVLGALFPAN